MEKLLAKHSSPCNLARMMVRFSKMHGLGNDFAVFDLVTQDAKLTADRVRQLADRHTGIGFDQLLAIEPPTTPDCDFTYRIYNADGSEVGQCGNGARCLASFLRTSGLTSKAVIRVATQDRQLDLEILADERVRVNMGAPQFQPDLIPFVARHPAASHHLQTSAGMIPITAVSMGNPHAVLLTPDVASAPVQVLGPEIEHHARFPEQANVGFMQIIDRTHVRLRVHERGVGETRACGTGACAAAVAGKLLGLLDEEVEVSLPGGSLTVNWSGAGQPVWMTGTATHVYEGKVDV